MKQFFWAGRRGLQGCQLRRWNPDRSVRDIANAQLVSCARARQGAVQSLSRPACKPTVQPTLAKCLEKRLKGGHQAFAALESAKPHCFARRENFPLLKSIKFQQIMAGHGGRRKGAGRPAGSRNKPRLIDDLPITDCPEKWLLALVNHTAAPLRVRVNAAKALMPFMHPPG